MDQQEQNSSNLLKDNNEFGESSKSPPSTNSTFLSFSHLDNSDSVFKHNSLNRDIIDPGKYLDLQRMLIDQGNAVMALKMSEYEKCLAEKDNTIKSLHTDMMNSQNNNYVLTNKCKNIMEKTKSVSYTCVRLNESFTNICDRLNKLGVAVENARTRQKDVMNLVDQTTNTFQEKSMNISNNIEDSLKQANKDKMEAKQEIEILENKYSLDLATYKSNLEKCAKEYEDLKTENNMLMEKLNETNIRLNEEKQLNQKQIKSLHQNHEKVLKEMEDQNISQIKSLNDKYEEIMYENQSLKNEIGTLNIFLDEKKEQVDNMQLTVIKEQTELFDKLKISEELNDALKKENFSLKEHCEYLEKNYADLMEDMGKIKLSHKEIQDEMESKIKDMNKHFDELLKIQEEKLVEKTKQILLQNEKECNIQAEVIDLKQALDESNNTIFNLQEELKTNHILIPELQNKIDDLSFNLANAHQKLHDNLQNQESIIEINNLKKEKSELEIQTKEHFKQIEKLTVNYMKYKSKVGQLVFEVMRLRGKCSPSEQINTSKKFPISETIESLSDEDINMEIDDRSEVELNTKDMDVNIQSTSYLMKRNSLPVRQSNNSKVKKCLKSNDNISSQVVECNNKDVTNMNVSLQPTTNKMKRNSSPLRQINKSKVKKHKTSIDNIYSQVNKENCQNLQNNESKTSLNETYGVNNVSKNPVTKKLFKIPDDFKPTQKKSKPTNAQNIDWSKPNSPVFLIPAPKQKNP